MEREQIQKIVEQQREFFLSGATLPVEFRKKALTDLKHAIKEYEDKIADAIKRIDHQ